VFQKHVFRCFIYLRTYVAYVVSKYFKSRSDVAHGMPIGSERGRERFLHASARRGQRPGSTGPAWERETQVRAETCWRELGRGVQAHARETDSLFGWLAARQPAVLFSHIKSAPATSYLPVSSIFLSQQISTGHQPPASRTS
jgi:hypothetical protein